MPKATVRGGRTNFARAVCPRCGSHACLVQSPQVCRHTGQLRLVGEQGTEAVQVAGQVEVRPDGADPGEAVGGFEPPVGDEVSLTAGDWALANPSIGHQVAEDVIDAVGEAAAAPADEPVPVGTAAEVLAWVGDDPVKAARALAVEQARERPRSTVLAELTRRAG